MPQTTGRITKDDIEAGFVRIEKIQEETARVLKESMEDTKKLKDNVDETARVLKESMEDTRKLKESMEVENRKLKESIEDTNKALKESMEDTRKLKDYVEETSRALNVSVGGLNKTMGNMSESMLVPSLVKKFNQLGFTFENMDRRKKVESDENEIITELDAFLESKTHAMAVEVKTTLRRNDVDYHAERMEKIRGIADLHDDKRQLLGAMGAAVVDDDTRLYTLNHGFYLIEPLAEDVRIVEPGAVKVW